MTPDEVLAALVVPDGFSKRSYVDEWKNTRVALESADVRVTFDVVDGNGRAMSSGSTDFLTESGWRTFDRRGIDQSFYWRPWDGSREADPTPERLNEIVAEQVARAREGIERHRGAVRITCLPGITTMTRSSVDAHRSALASRGETRITPAGMGTGYVVSLKKSRWSRPAPKELCDLLIGGAPLHLETFDHD